MIPSGIVGEEREAELCDGAVRPRWIGALTKLIARGDTRCARRGVDARRCGGEEHWSASRKRQWFTSQRQRGTQPALETSLRRGGGSVGQAGPGLSWTAAGHGQAVARGLGKETVGPWPLPCTMPESVGQRLFAPPPGPPPGYSAPSAPAPRPSYAPPPPAGPPPGYDELRAHYPAQSQAPPPPPPVLSYAASPALNASEDACAAGDAFVAAHPLAPPRRLLPQESAAIDSGQMHLLPPAAFVGSTTRGADGTTLVQSRPGCADCTLLSHVPLYSASRQAPNTIYYEIQLLQLARDASIAIGFCAVPYPPFRLPGWHRGSIGVHADDGHRYACDAEGGVELTEPFQPGDVVGLGLELRTGVVWFTRNGALAGGWNLREGRSAAADAWGNEWDGLDGASDVYAAVGVCGAASAIVNVGGARAGRPWAWTPAA